MQVNFWHKLSRGERKEARKKGGKVKRRGRKKAKIIYVAFSSSLEWVEVDSNEIKRRDRKDIISSQHRGRIKREP